MEVRPDDLTGAEIAGLLQEHRRSMYLHSPPESVHALDLDALRQPGITMWTAWQSAELLGCGALKELDPRPGDLVSFAGRIVFALSPTWSLDPGIPKNHDRDPGPPVSCCSPDGMLLVELES